MHGSCFSTALFWTAVLCRHMPGVHVSSHITIEWAAMEFNHKRNLAEQDSRWCNSFTGCCCCRCCAAVFFAVQACGSQLFPNGWFDSPFAKAFSKVWALWSNANASATRPCAWPLGNHKVPCSCFTLIVSTPSAACGPCVQEPNATAARPQFRSYCQPQYKHKPHCCYCRYHCCVCCCCCCCCCRSRTSLGLHCARQTLTSASPG
jgi:hypothetical protein